MYTHVIETKNIPDAWFQCIYDIFNDEKGYADIWKVDRGSYAGQFRRQFQSILIEIENPCDPELKNRVPMNPEGKILPNPIDPVIYPKLSCPVCSERVLNFKMLDGRFFTSGCNHEVSRKFYEMYRPTVESAIIKYFANYLFSKNLSINEQYTYGSRVLESVAVPEMIEGGNGKEKNPVLEDLNKNFRNHCLGSSVNFKEEIIFYYPQYYYLCSYLRTNPMSNQIIMQVGKPSDVVLPDPPCCRHVDMQVRNGKLDWYIYFRSWDLWGGLPLNLAGLSMLMDQMCVDTNLEPGMFVCHSKGLHLYEHSWGAALARLGR